MCARRALCLLLEAGLGAKTYKLAVGSGGVKISPPEVLLLFCSFGFTC